MKSIISSVLVVAATTFISTSASAQVVDHQWNFDAGNFLTDSVATADLTVTPADSVTQVGNTASFDGTGVLETNQALYGVASVNPLFSVEMVITLDAIPSSRTAFVGEFQNNGGGNNRGWEFYTEASGALIFALGNTNNTSSAFFPSTNVGFGGDANFVIEAGKQYYIGAAVDLSQVNDDVSNFESASITYFLENLTDGTPQESVTITRTMRNLSSGGQFTIGGRDGATGNLISADYDSVTLSTGLIPEPSTYGLIGAAIALGVAMLRRRK